MPDDPAKLPRFPYVGALLCAACVGVAAWLFLRYSYSWELRPDEFVRLHRSGGARGVLSRLRDRYATFRFVRGDRSEDLSVGHILARIESGEAARLHVYFADTPTARASEDVVLSGRVCVGENHDGVAFIFDPSSSRWTPQTIAGLVVGAMGVFVFTVALRHWLRERRCFREDMKGHNQSVERPPSAS
jgi:hypothetical protein